MARHEHVEINMQTIRELTSLGRRRHETIGEHIDRVLEQSRVLFHYVVDPEYRASEESQRELQRQWDAHDKFIRDWEEHFGPGSVQHHDRA